MKRIKSTSLALVATTTLALLAGGAQAAVSFYQEILDGESKTIVTMGTSLTNPNYSTWVGLTETWLKSEAPDPNNVTFVNVSRSGHNSEYARTSELPNALSANPDVVFFEFGINDAYTAYDPAYVISVVRAKENLNYFIDQLEAQNSDVDIVLMTMNNAPGNPGPRPNLDAYYQNYRDVAEDRGLLLIDHHANWVDLYTNDLATWNSYGVGGTHPNLAGTTDVIMPKIQASLQVPEPSTTALLGLGGLALILRRRK
jgi:acyl-CoA thioesterase-1